jgi:subtilisin family serine protease
MDTHTPRSTSQKVVFTFVVLLLVFGFARAIIKSPIGLVGVQGDSMSQALNNQNANVFDSIKNFFSKIFGKGSFGGGKLTDIVIDNNNGENFKVKSDSNTVVDLLALSGESLVNVGSDNTAIIPSENNSISNSYILTFKADPMAIRQKEILKTKGVVLATEENRALIAQKLKESTPQINLHKTKIQNEQNQVLSRIGNTYDLVSSRSTPNRTVYTNGSKDIYVSKFSMTSNSVVVKNISESELANLVKGLSSIESIEPVQRVTVSLTDTADVINSAQLSEYVGANGAMLTGQGVSIGIVDTGVDYTHQDLGSCSFLTTANCKVMGGYDFINNDSDPMDDHGHGTHVAGTSAGNGYYTSSGNNIPLKGIAPDAKIYAYKVLSADGSGSSDSVVAGIERCVDPNNDGLTDDHLDICSLSLGSASGNPLDSQSSAVDAGVDAGVVFTIAAGNAGPGAHTIGSPGTSRKAITVGAACKPSQVGVSPACSEQVASFSSRGPEIFVNENGITETLQKPDIIAPGVSICAAQFDNYSPSSTCLDSAHIAISGTSMATPVVAGLSALLVQAHPEMSPAQIKDALMVTATNYGLDGNTQGSGMVHGENALSLLGIPSSILGVTGLPVSVYDTSDLLSASFSESVSIKNISDVLQNVSFALTSTNPGVDYDLPGGSQALSPNASFTLPISGEINHAEASSGIYKNDTINISSELGELPLIVSRFTPPKITLSDSKLSFGLFHASQDNFSKTLSLTLNNRMDTLAETFTITNGSFSDSDATLTSSASSVTVAPNGSSVVSFTVNANSVGSALSYGEYTTYIVLTSATETHTIKVSFYHGYAFSFSYGDDVPDFITLQIGVNQYSYNPNPSSNQIVLHSPYGGEIDASATYTDDLGSNTYEVSHVLRLDINLLNSTELQNYPVDKELAVHSIENEYFANACIYAFNKPGNGGQFRYTLPGYLTVKYNTLPNDYGFSMGCHDLKTAENKIVSHQIYIDQNINQNYVLNDSTASKSQSFVYGLNHVSPGSDVGFGSTLCSFREFDFDGGITNASSLCYQKISSGSSKIVVDENQAVLLEGYTLATKNPETALYPDYPSQRIFTFNPSNLKPIAYSPEFFTTEEKLYLWNTPKSGNLTTSTSSHDMYEKNKIVPPTPNTFSIGALPLVEVSAVRASNQKLGFFANNTASSLTTFQFADGSQELLWFSTGITEVLHNFLVNNVSYGSVNQQQKTHPAAIANNSQVLPRVNNSFNYAFGTKLGLHSVTTKRLSPFRSESGEDFSRSFTTEIFQNGVHDSVPPFIQTIELVSNGLLQSYYDQAGTQTLRIKLNPGYGIETYNDSVNSHGAHAITFMDDSLSSVVLKKGSTKDSLSVVPGVFVDGGWYEVPLVGGGTTDKEYFSVDAVDGAGNTYTYLFYLPVGTAITMADLGVEGLGECVEGDVQFYPTTTPISLSVGQVIPVELNFLNTSSPACGALSVDVSFSKGGIGWDQIINPLKFGLTSTTATSNSFSAGGFAQNISSGLVGKSNFYLSTTSNATPGVYEMKVKVTDANIDGPSGFPIENIYVVNIVAPGDENACLYSNPTVAFVDTPTNLSEGGAEVPFSVSVTNNNSPSCPSETYTLTVSDNSTHIGVGSTPPLSGTTSFTGSVTGASGQTVPIPLYLKAFPGSFVSDAVVTAVLTGTTPDVSVTSNTGVSIAGVCEGDFTGDNKVNVQDFILLNGAINPPNLSYDLSGDGQMSFADITLFTGLMGTICTN